MEGGAETGLIETLPRRPSTPGTATNMGHMNVMWYVGKFDEGTWNLIAGLGLTAAWLRDNQRGMAAVDQRIAYQRELRAGETVVIRSGVLEVRPKVLRFAHRMFNAETGELAAVTQLVGAFIDTEARRALPFPARDRREGARAARDDGTALGLDLRAAAQESGHGHERRCWTSSSRRTGSGPAAHAGPRAGLLHPPRAAADAEVHVERLVPTAACRRTN